MYSFVKENGKYQWFNKEIMVQFSNASFQAHDEYKYIVSDKDILYFYYTVSLFKKAPGQKHWKEISSHYVYDFPAIFDLKLALQELLNQEFDKETAQKRIIKRNDNYGETKWYRQTIDLTDSFCEDAYVLSKCLIEFEDETREECSLYIGLPVDPQCDSNSVGINITYLSVDDLKQLLTMCNSFIEDAIVYHNQIVRKDLIESLNTAFTVNEQYLVLRGQDCLDNVIQKGEKCSLTVLYGEIQNQNYYSRAFNCTIEKINDDDVVISGYDENDHSLIEHMKIDVKNIITAFSEIHEEKLSYSIEEIEKDFLPLFNDLDLSSLFESEKDLLKRWRNVLTSRYWMYRDEHHFLDNVKSPKERDETIDKLILRMFKHIKENKQ